MTFNTHVCKMNNFQSPEQEYDPRAKDPGLEGLIEIQDMIPA